MVRGATVTKVVSLHAVPEAGSREPVAPVVYCAPNGIVQGECVSTANARVPMEV